MQSSTSFRWSLVGVAWLIGATVAGSSPQKTSPPRREDKAAILAVQVRLDRLGFSPGEIDGRPGANTRKALAAFRRARNLAVTADDRPDTAARQRLEEECPEDPLVHYVTTADDLAGPFVDRIPADLMEQTKLPALSYTSPLEALGEKFHTSPAILRFLNPNASFTVAGEDIRVPNVSTQPPSTVPLPKQGVADVTVIVSKTLEALQVLDGQNRVIFHAPVTVGSEHDPLPIAPGRSPPSS